MDKNRGGQKRRFAFLIHPRNGKDIGHLMGQKVGIGGRLGRRLVPEWLTPLLWKGLRLCCKVVVCGRCVVSEEVEGFVIGLPMTAAEMVAGPRKQVMGEIVDAVLFAREKLGCSVVGLGAYTAPLSLNGKAVADDPRINCAVTHGDALSAASAVAAVRRAADLRGLDIERSTVAVVGGYGLVGRAAAILTGELNPAGMILTGPNSGKLRKVAAEMAGYRGKVACSTDNRSAGEADIVVLCTTATGDVIGPGDLKQDAVVIDMAQPPNMSREVCCRRPDVLRLDGGFLHTGIAPGFEMGPPAGVTLACFTETMLLAMAGDRDHHVGPVDIGYARLIWKRAVESGYDLAPFTSFGKPVLTRSREGREGRGEG